MPDQDPINFQQHSFPKEELITIYKQLVLPRLIEEKMLILLRQGKISKWFSGWGQEAVSVGVHFANAPQFGCIYHPSNSFAAFICAVPR
jgi:TPP-dependent pyruvate/acetoin dehydrogenase alpha subunit